MATSQIVKIKVNKLDVNTENVGHAGFRHILRDTLHPVPFTPTAEQIKIYHEKYKDLYSQIRRQ
jgi:hypothetical protein